MVDIGYFSLLIAVLVSGYAAVAAVVGARCGRGELVRSAENSTFAVAGLLTIGMVALLYAFLARDFQVAYVANYSSRNLPLIYTVSALWGGQEGSLLLWGWLLAIFAAVVVFQNRRQNRALMPYVVAVLMSVELFFLVLVAFITSPFARLDFVPADGRGLNPLLQNPGMIFHPPTLYLGYVGFTVPFAFAVSALITGQLGDLWIRSTRRWTIFSWFFLGVGILFGAQWAYVELGWGGYWAWDPVENASLMPWLTGTAYLHSVMIQERKNMLKVWNMVLIIMTFLLCIFGTFITRSGIVSSVHSFGQSALGPFFLAFIGVALIGAFALLVDRLPLLRSTNELDSLISRESSFLFNNLILVGAAFSIFWGTVFPMISEAVRGVKITVGPPFFNQVNIPIGLALLFLTGICPLIAWRKASGRNLRRNFLVPFIIALLGGALLFAVGVRHGYTWLSFTLSIFVLSTIGSEFLRGVRARHNMASENYLVALARLIWRNKRRYGGYIVHVGMVLIFLGITGSSAFKVEREVHLSRGESVELRDYTIAYESLVQYPTANKEVVAATLSVYRGGRRLGSLSPAIETYKHEEEHTTSEVAIRSTLKEDLYAILAGYEPDGSAATFKLIVSPLVAWIWIGGAVLSLGTVIVMLPDRRERERLQVKYAREVFEDEVYR
ncbi:MAG: heme lyase CcmF/NrfE family subunit [bacterium]